MAGFTRFCPMEYPLLREARIHAFEECRLTLHVLGFSPAGQTSKGVIDNQCE